MAKKLLISKIIMSLTRKSMKIFPVWETGFNYKLISRQPEKDAYLLTKIFTIKFI